MEKNGFTLVELLAVIVILSILITIVTVIVNPTIENSKNKLSKIQIQYIEESANTYYLKEGVNNEYEGNSFEMCVDLSYLIENDYIENEEILNPKDYEKSDGSVKITYKFDQISYKYQENNCTYKYQSIDNICSLENDVDPIGISIGDKYQCKVKDDMEQGFEEGYYFYVLSFDDKQTANLIMDRNINSDGTLATKGIQESQKEANGGIYNLVPWISNSEFGCVERNCARTTKGPITAMRFLYEATKSWSNIDPLNYTYKDKETQGTTQEDTSYISFLSNNGMATITSLEGEIISINTGSEPLRARLPIEDEVHEEGKCKTEKENGNKLGGCPLWLYNYLNVEESLNVEGLQNINKIYGYWTISSYPDVSSNGPNIGPNIAYFVYYKGLITCEYVSDEINHGIRPVITLPKNEIQIKIPM